MTVTTSAADARLLRTPSGRRAAGRFLVEGPHAVAEAAASGHLLEVFATAAAAERHRDLLGSAPVTVVGERVLAGLADTRTPQGLVAVARLLTVPLDHLAALLPAPVLVAVLVAPSDPGNAGTVVRTADAAGADAVLFCGSDEPGVDPHNGKCVRASAGSVFHLPLAVGTVEQSVRWLRTAGLQLLAADAAAPVELGSVEADRLLRAPTAWLFGNEAHGLDPSVLALADTAVRVPMYGRAESLNLATAAGLCLYASARVRHAGSGR